MVPGQEVLVADDAEAFAAAVRRLLDDPAYADRLAAAGRKVAERYGWPRLAEGFADVVLAEGTR